MTIPLPMAAMRGSDRPPATALDEALAAARQVAEGRLQLLQVDIGRIAEAAGYTVGDIRGRVRSAELTEVRRIVVRYLRAQEPPLSWPAIGRAINRDHTTAMHLGRPRIRTGGKGEGDG